MINVESDHFIRYDQPNERLVELIVNSEVHKPRILDVGCWGGALGRRVRMLLECSIDGIDINAEVLRVAVENGYAETYCLDLNTGWFGAIANRTYDVIVFGDVLEHTIDPGAVLRKLLPKLKPRGFVVVSLPNIGFLWYRLLHLIGIWEYRESGVMDKTHLRFFTYPAMKRFFWHNGMKICETRPYIGIRNFPPPVRESMRFLARLWPSLFALQIVFKLTSSLHGTPPEINAKDGR